MAIAQFESTYDEAEFPEIVYKYRFWNSNYPFHKKVLTDQQLFFASPKSFEDKVDCKNLVRYDLLTREEVFEMYLNQSKTRWPERTDQMHMDFANEGFSQTRLFDQTYVREYMENLFDETCNRIGILSLTEYNDSIPMWEKYSDDHTGICVGFNSKETFQFFHGGGKVEYFETLPIIKPRPFHSFSEQMLMQVFCKEKKWEFEQEYRTQLILPPGTVATAADRTVTIPKTAIREVIIGALASQQTVNEVTEIVNNNLPHVEIRRAIIDNGVVMIG